MAGRKGPTTGCLFGLVLAANVARAEPPVDVEIGCTELDPESRAALEARARADLAARAFAGKLSVTCERGVLEVSLVGEHALALRRSERQPDDAAATVDLALASLDALLGPPASPVEPSRAASVPPPSREPPPTAVASPPKASALLVWLAAGADFQGFVGSSALGAAGPYGAVRFTTGLVSVDLQGGARFGISVPSAFSIRVGEGIVGADVSLPMASAFSFGAGVGVSYLVAAAPVGGSPDSRSSASAVGRLRARYRLDLGAFDLHLGPELGVLAPPIVIRDHGVELTRAPALSFGVALDAGVRIHPWSTD